MRPRMRFWRGNICRSIIGALRGRRRSRRITIARPLGREHSRTCCISRPSMLWAMTGWYAMRIAIFNCMRAPGIMRRPKPGSGLRMGGRALADPLSRSAGGLGGDSRASSGCSPRGYGPETKAAHAQSGSPLAAGFYRTLRPWSKPGTPTVSLIHELSDRDSTGSVRLAGDGERSR